MIDQSLVVGDVLFTAHRDRALYLGKSAGGQAQWLKEHADKWQFIQNVQQGAAAEPRPLVESEISIGPRQYVSARRVASMLGVSVRTLSRWDAAGIGPPKIKVGKLILYDLGKLTEWLASRESRPAAAVGRKTPGGSHE
jgi:predicted DNA-binding transcriptional regulator AlpA